MRILYDHQIFIRQKYGGISRYFYELIRHALEQERTGVSLYQGLHVNYYHLASQKERFNDYFGIQHDKIYKSGPILSLVNGIGFKTWLKKIKSPVDIYHPTYYYPLKVKTKRTIMTVYDMIHEKYPQYLKGARSFSEHKRKILNKADKIIAISKNTKNDLIKLFNMPAEKIAVVPLAASDSFQPLASEGNRVFLKRYNLDKPYILYVGDRVGYKNFITLLKAFSQWSKKTDYYLVCLGGGDSWLKGEVELINRHNLAANLKLLSGINDDELRLFYAYAQMFIVTSLYEGFGITPLEAMKCGTPVIVSNSSSLPEVVGEAGLYFDPSSVQGLINCMEKLANSKEVRTLFSQRGLMRGNCFSWERTAKDTLAVYKQLIS